MKNESINKATYLVLSLGVILHVYLAVMRSMESVINFILVPILNLLPYAICLIILIKAKKSMMALCAGLSILVTDIFLFNSFIFNPRALGYGLLGVFTPVWKVGLVLPIGCVIGLMIDKYARGRQQQKPD